MVAFPARLQSTRQESAADWAAQVAAGVGARPESSGYFAAISAWRNAWRPSRIRVLLIAESHVAEEPGDEDVEVDTGSAEMPRRFCRLIYCLGYGEPTLCRPRSPANNTGTRQFWSIFSSLVEGRLAQAPTGLKCKVQILEAMRERGIWLVDASVMAIAARGGGRLVPPRLYPHVLR